MHQAEALLARLGQLYGHGATSTELRCCAVLQAMLDDACSSKVLYHGEHCSRGWGGCTGTEHCCVVLQDALDYACSSQLLRHAKALLVRVRQLHWHGAAKTVLHCRVVLQAVLDDACFSQLLHHTKALLARVRQLHWHGATCTVLRCCVVLQAVLGLLSAPLACPSILILCLQLPWCGRCEALSCTTIKDHLITPALKPFEELQRL